MEAYTEGKRKVCKPFKIDYSLDDADLGALNTLDEFNGWNCRCTVKSLSQKDLDRLGLTVENSASKLRDATAELPDGTKVQGKVYRTNGKTVRTDVGWNYNPGKAAYKPMDDGKDPALRAEMDKILKNKTDSFLNEEEKNEAENNISKSMKNYMNEYGSETQGGFTSIKILKNMQYRSGTTCNGIYYLSEEVAKQFNSALLKIPKGEPLSLSEEESGKTQWHEIYHNRAEFPLPSNATPNQINAMELLNEFVSRRTYNIFWQRFNYPVQYQKTIIEYAETGYQPQQEKFNKFMRDYDLDTPENLVELEEILIKKPQVEIAANLRNWLIQKTKIEGETAVQAKLRKESIKKELKRIIKNID
ncbi:hypothetical protein J5690_06545 [bacterium]|nr:hypothetical protein [bacterium]